MSSRISRIEDFLSRAMPLHAAATLRLRGLVVPAEPFLKGKPRFARLSGSPFAVISPDNTMALASPARQGTSTLSLARLVSWVEPGCKLRIEGREVVTVADVSAENRAVSLVEPLREDHGEKVSVVLHAVQVRVDGSESAGATIIVIKTPLDVVYGDQLLIDTVEYAITAADHVNDDILTGEKVWQITLSAGLHRALVDQGIVHLRAHPAYVRLRCPIPSIPRLAAATAGPILLDRVSGAMRGPRSFPEFVSVRLLRSNNSPIGDPIAARKNLPVIRQSISSEALLFWDVANGKVRWDGAHACGVLVDEGDGLGRFRVVKKLDPPFPTGQVTEWRVQVKPVTPAGAGPTRMSVRIDPGPAQEFLLVNNVRTTVRVLFPSADAERIRIALTGQPGAHVEIGAFTVAGSLANAIDYSIVAHVDGVYRWASSGMLVKPYFLSLGYVRANFDSGAAFDSGYLMLE